MSTRTSRFGATAAVCASALILPALAAAPASALLVNGKQDIRSYACPPGAIPDGDFDDVVAGEIAPEFYLGISCLKAYEITLGTGDGTTYSPGDAVSRRQMALFLARQADLLDIELDATSAGFADIGGQTEEVRDAVNILANAGITIGVDSADGVKRFDPLGLVRRDQMAAFINRLQNAAAEANDDVSPFAANASRFPDTTNANVGALAAAGVVSGRADGTYAPAASVTRAQMSAFLTRQLNAALQAGDFDETEPPRATNNAFDVTNTSATTTPPSPADQATFTSTGLLPSTLYRITLVNTDAFEVVDDDTDDDDTDGTDQLVQFDTVAVDDAGTPAVAKVAATAVPGSAGAMTGGSDGAQVTSVNAMAPEGGASRSVLATTDAAGTLTITVAGNNSDVTVTPFVYRADLPGLEYPNYETLLEVERSAGNVPVELFGYAETPAVFGTGSTREATDDDADDGVSGTVTAVDTDTDSVTIRTAGATPESITFVYEDDDTFNMTDGTEFDDVDAFEDALSNGDTLTVDTYFGDAEGDSEFTLTTDADFVTPPVTRDATDADDDVTGTVTAVDAAGDTFTLLTPGTPAESITFTYDDNDTFSQADGTSYTTAAFEAALSVGDSVAVSAYSTTASDTSAFRIDTDN